MFREMSRNFQNLVFLSFYRWFFRYRELGRNLASSSVKPRDDEIIFRSYSEGMYANRFESRIGLFLEGAAWSFGILLEARMLKIPVQPARMCSSARH